MLKYVPYTFNDNSVDMRIKTFHVKNSLILVVKFQQN